MAAADARGAWAHQPNPLQSVAGTPGTAVPALSSSLNAAISQAEHIVIDW